jgi:hypothetical protein
MFQEQILLCIFCQKKKITPTKKLANNLLRQDSDVLENTIRIRTSPHTFNEVPVSYKLGYYTTKKIHHCQIILDLDTVLRAIQCMI